MRWLIAGGVLIAAFALGSGVAAQVRRFLSAPARPRSQRELAVPAASFAFSMLLAVGLVVALGIGSPESLDPLPGDLIAFLPKLLVGGLILLAGSTAGQLVGNTVGKTLLRATGKPQPQLVRVVRFAFTGASTILAVNQIGIDTRVLDMVIAAFVFGTAASIALLTGLGGRDIAREVAAGRYVGRIVAAGDHVSIGTIRGAGPGDQVPLAGVVRHVHSVTVELEGPDGEAVHVPHAVLLQAPLTIVRTPAARTD